MPRKTNKIPSNKTILIVVEGQTEQIYFSEMNVYERNKGISVTTRKASHSDIGHIINSAISENSSGVYDSIWCVFDRDTVQRDNLETKLPQLIKKATQKGIKIADSNPAFEIWFLAHYQKPQLYYSSQDALIDELKKHIDGYVKDCRWLERKNIYSLLKDKQEQAIINCSILEQDTLAHGDKCSRCRVHDLVQFLLSN